MRFRLACQTSVLVALLALGLPLSLDATTVLEQVGWGRCSEGAEEALPKKITLLQVINDKAFSNA